MRSSRFLAGWLNLLCMTLVVTVVLPAPSAGRVLKIWPDRMQKRYDSDLGIKFVYYLASESSGGIYYDAPIKLPVGSVIRKIEYYHRGPVSPVTSVSLGRIKMGNPSAVVAQVASTTPTNDIILVGRDLDPPHTVEAGYRYNLTAYGGNQTSYIHGIRITYTPPGP